MLYGRFHILGRFIIEKEELFGNWIRFIIETYFELMIASVIGVGLYKQKSGIADEWTWTSNCVMLALVAIFPVFVFISTVLLVISRKNRAKKYSFIQVLMEGLKMTGVGAPFSMLILILRRISFFAAVLLFQTCRLPKSTFIWLFPLLKLSSSLELNRMRWDQWTTLNFTMSGQLLW